MKYHVGQIIYVILQKKGQVYPMMVIEEITKKTLKGEETNYVLQAGSNQASTILMSDLEGEVFTTAREAKDVLVARATAQIERIVENASKKAEEWYSRGYSDDVIHELPEPQVEEQMVTLPDGTTARLKFPT
jgi:hypothetical protein